MRLRLRLLIRIIVALLRKPMRCLDESVLTLRVLPNDVDITKISEDRYFALMDLGRIDVAFRRGLLKAMIRKKWAGLATFSTIRFRYPLKLFQKYQLCSRIIWWNNNTFYFEQRFQRKGRTLATGYVCATLLGPEGPIAPEEVIAATGQLVTKPPKPDIVVQLDELETKVHEEQKDQRSAHS